MQRKPGFPVANCSIKMPDSMPLLEPVPHEDAGEQVQKLQQLINFGHSQWGFNNWSWSVSKQELDFVDFSNGKHCAGVVAFVSVTVKSFEISRENIGYATSMAPNKGSAIYKSRKCAVTNALRETLLSFGGSVATELMELLESTKSEPVHPPPIAPAEPIQPENNQNAPNKLEPKNSPLNKNIRKDVDTPANVIRSPHPTIKNVVPNPPPPVAKAHPIPVSVPPANRPPLPANVPRPPAPPVPPPPHIRPNSNDPKPLEGMSEEEARAERKRRQRLAQEEFRLKQMMKKPGNDDMADLEKSSSFDRHLMDIPTQDIVIEEAEGTAGGEGGSAGGPGTEGGKRKSPAPEGCAKRRSCMNRLDIVTD